MILKYDLSLENIALLALPSGEEICYCVPFDIDEHGNFLNNSYVVATKKRIIVLSCGARKEQYLLSDCEKVASEPQIDCGLFIVKTDGEERILARFSGKHLARFSYVARGLMMFLSGNMSLVSSDEYERTCPKCHRALPGTRECPHCSRQGGGTANSSP